MHFVEDLSGKIPGAELLYKMKIYVIWNFVYILKRNFKPFIEGKWFQNGLETISMV